MNGPKDRDFRPQQDNQSDKDLNQPGYRSGGANADQEGGYDLQRSDYNQVQKQGLPGKQDSNRIEEDEDDGAGEE